MIKFMEVNVNPKKIKTGDCSTRALVGTLGISYDEALKLQCEESLKCYYDITSKQVMESILNKFGYVKMPQPRKPNGKKYRVGEMDKILTEKQLLEGVLISVPKHYTVIKNNQVEDTWDCRTYVVGNYYVKVGGDEQC